MAVGVMCWKGLDPYLAELRTLATDYPVTAMIIDHLGFFRQAPNGGLLGTAAVNDEGAWEGLIELSRFPNVHVKVSALFRSSAELPPHHDLGSRITGAAGYHPNLTHLIPPYPTPI